MPARSLCRRAAVAICAPWLWFAAACGGSGGGDSDRYSIAFNDERSDVSHIFVSDRKSGFVALRRTEGPVMYFMRDGEPFARFVAADIAGAKTLSVGDTSITQADVDSDGQLELVVVSPDGTTTYEPEDMQAQAASNSQALSREEIEQLGQEIDATIEVFATLRGDIRFRWVVDLIQDLSEAGAAYERALSQLDRTLSDWAGRDPFDRASDEDRELISSDVVAVEPAREAQVVEELFSEAEDRLAGHVPATAHFSEAIEERVSEDSSQPAVWSEDSSSNGGVGGDSGAGGSGGTSGIGGVGGMSGGEPVIRCIISYRGADGVVALMEQACVSSHEQCAAKGGETLSTGSAAGSASECSDWCQTEVGVHFASSELDGSNLKCYETKCVSTVGQVASPQALTGDDACAAGCAADYCEQSPEPTEAWVTAELDGSALPVEGATVVSFYQTTANSDMFPGDIEISVSIDDGDVHRHFSARIGADSHEAVRSCDTSGGAHCHVSFSETIGGEWSRSYGSLRNSVDTSGHGQGTIEITSNSGLWVEGSFEVEMREFGTTVTDESFKHVMKASFRAEKL